MTREEHLMWYTLPIVGARFRPPAEDVLNLMPSGSPLVLRRQPENPHDANAVQVLMVEYDSWLEVLELSLDNMPIHLGFIPRESAREIAPVMDESTDTVCTNGHDLCFQGPSIDCPYCETRVNEWNGKLTFSATGRPMITFDTSGDTQ